jgi:hypothetical protein
MFRKVKEYEGSRNIVVEDKVYGTDEVTLKWDGCIDYRIGSNGVKPSEDETGDNTDYIHICDIDEFIVKLQALKELGIKHFNNEYWKKKKKE